jgi:hypothetical protein
MPYVPARTALAAVVLVTSVSFGPAQSQEISIGPLPTLAEAREELRKRVPDFERHAAQTTEAERQTFVRELQGRTSRQVPKTDSASIRSATGSVAAAARCRDGYVLEGKHAAPDRSVKIVSENLRDCDVNGCRAYEVSAISESSEPFDLNVSVVCSN